MQCFYIDYIRVLVIVPSGYLQPLVWKVKKESFYCTKKMHNLYVIVRKIGRKKLNEIVFKSMRMCNIFFFMF